MPQGKKQRDAKRRPTRDDVAELAGVSSAVVSYVMNDGPRNVAPATRQRVLDAVEELGYRPNDVARSLRSQTNRMVGLVVESSIGSGLNSLTEGVTQVLSDQSYLLTVARSSADQENEAQAVRLLAKRVDGVLFVPSDGMGDVPALLREEGVPVVAVGVKVDGLPSVFVDPAASGLLATQHLLSLGHTRIGVLQRSGSDAQSTSYRQGCEQALTQAGQALDPGLVLAVEAGIDAGSAAASQLLELDDPPTAIVTQNDLTALGVLDELQRRDIAVPEDFSVVSVDDLELGQHTAPMLTTVPSRSAEVGRTAARTLLKRIHDQAAPMSTVVDPEVVVRESSGNVRRVS